MEQDPAPRRRSKRVFGFVLGGVALAVIVAAVVVGSLHNSVARSVLGSVARAFGYSVAVGTLDVNFGHAIADDVRVTNLAGEPVLETRHVAVTYSLRDLLPGGTRLFGLKSVDVDAPHVTVVHHRDGTYNITLPASSAKTTNPSSAALDVTFGLQDGSIDLIDRFVAAPRERRTRIVDVHARGAISPSRPSTYRAGAVLIDGTGRFPIDGSGRFEDARGFELQRWTAARLPVAPIVNLVLPTHAFVVQAGELRNLDLTLGALSTPGGTMQSHLGIRVDLAGGRIASSALTKPVRDAHGSFVVEDDGATIRSLDASLNGLPLHVRGTLYHFADPQVAIGLTVRGDLARVRALSKDIATLPVGGAIAVQGLAEGPAGNPVIFARFGAPNISYGAFRFDGTRGFVAVSGQELDVLSAGLRYGAIDLAARGALQLQAHTQTAGYALVRAPANTLPFVDAIVPGMALGGSAVVRGADGKLAVRGYLGGRTVADRLDVPFSLDASGTGTVGPVALERGDGASLYGRAALDRTTKQTVAIADVRRLSLLPAPAVTLPGLALPALPARLDARVDATVAAAAHGTALTSASGTVHGYGSWGDVRASADGDGSRVAARGRITSSFERLAVFTGDIGARGGIEIPFAVTNGTRSTIVQIANARFPGASVRGIPLDGASATLGIAGRAVDVYAADLRIAGRDVTAQGSFGNGGRLHVTAADVDVAALGLTGLPLTGGRASVIADVGGTTARPTGTVRAALAGARYAGTDVGGDVGVDYDGAALHVNRATLTYGGAYANAVGTVAGLELGRRLVPRYDLHARLEDADIATLARTVKNPLKYPEGTLEADVRVGGAGSVPSLTGTLELPEGSINGLNFRAGRVGLSGTPAAIRATNGRLTFGATTLAFGGSASRTQQSVRLRSAALDLADFNDYFDEADVLAGTGRIALAVDAAPRHLTTAADVALTAVRYRRFALGRVGTTVHTVGSAIRIRSNVDGENGRAGLTGTVNVPVSDPLHDIVRRSYVDLSGQIAGINLGTVLPAAGLSLPVLGTVDGSAVVRGRYPALALTTRASLSNGVAGRLPIERLTVAATAANGRGRLTDASLVAPGLLATAAGTFGLRPADAFDLQAHVTSPNIETLATAATGKNPGVGGMLDTQARLTGTLGAPRLTSSIDLTNLTYAKLIVPRVHADIDATRQAAAVSNGLVTLPLGGSLAFDAHAPLRADTTTPIALNFAPRNANLAAYSPLLPDGSVVGGVIDGNVAVRGTLGAPQLAGKLNFERGSYRSNTVKLPLTAIALELDFADTTITIAKLHAHATPGNFDGSGTIRLADLRDPVRGLRANVNITAKNALISAPKYYVGYVDGTIFAKKRARSPLVLGGDLDFSSARIPYTALLPSGGATTGSAPALPDVGFDLGVKVGRDVRVQSGPVDIGTTGSARLRGTLAKPTLNGQFNATDGTVSVYRTFVVQNGSSVSFSPGDGIVPSVDATAVTQISDPATDVLLRITGLSTHLNLAFSSQPAYSQQQILGLLVNAQALGAVTGVAQTGSSTGGGPSISGIGEGLLNEQFTQKFLQPFTSKVGGALGLSDLNLNYNTNGAVSAIARRTIGKNISFTYGEQIGGPTPRTSVGINIGTAISGAQLTFFQTAGSSQAFGGQALTPYLQSGFLATSPPNYTLQAIEPPTGSGFVFSYQRHFW